MWQIENTLTVIKSESGNVFGGYIDKALTSITVPNAFIFSLINKENKSFKSICSNGGQNSILCHRTYGPAFDKAKSDI